MKIANTKLKKIIIISICAILFAVGMVIAFISPITKYVVEKYDKKWTGRKITMDWAYVNPFTGYIYFSNLKIHELKSDSVFFSSKSLSANFSMRKMFFKTYEITQVTLDHPTGIIIQNKTDLNFVDLIKKFTPAKTDTTLSGVHFSILKIKIKNGEFHYRENQIPINYFIKEVNYEGTGNRWDADTIAGTFSFKSGIGKGDMRGDFTINLKTDDYRYAVVIHKFDLNIIAQYLKDLTNYGSFSASLDADMKATGNFNNKEDVTAKGMLAINDFHFGKNPDDDYMSFDKFVMTINEMSPLKRIYLYDSVSLSHPYFKYELYDKSDNLETMFGKGGANVYAVAADHDRFNLIIEIARYVKVMARNFFQSYYKINRVAIYNGDLKFNDFSLGEKFSTSLTPLFVIADSIDKNHKRVDISFQSGIKPFGNATVAVSLNPKDTGDFDMQYHFQKLPAAMFNPYLISYTSFPLDRGTIELKGNWAVRKGEIQSVNHLLVIDPRVTKRIKNKNTAWLPLPLIFSFVREYGNVIDYEIPITGSLKNPKFHLKDVLTDVLANIFVKPVTTPYRMEVKNLENEIEKSLTLKWTMQQTVLSIEQEKFANKMSDFLADNPEAFITVYPVQYAVKEKEYILFFEAKKKYFMSLKEKDAESFSEDDSGKVNTMSVKDSLFIRYVNKHVSDTTLFTMQDKCSNLVGTTLVNTRFKQLNTDRESAFRFCFLKNNMQNRVQIQAAENTIPYNGFSFYKIEYKGQLPKSLTKAYEKLQELNDEAPRKKYEREQKKSAGDAGSLGQ
jgi:hypothetical protein